MGEHVLGCWCCAVRVRPKASIGLGELLAHGLGFLLALDWNPLISKKNLVSLRYGCSISIVTYGGYQIKMLDC